MVDKESYHWISRKDNQIGRKNLNHFAGQITEMLKLKNKQNKAKESVQRDAQFVQLRLGALTQSRKVPEGL